MPFRRPLWIAFAALLACGDTGGVDGGDSGDASDADSDICPPGDPSCGARCRFDSFFEGEPSEANLTQYEAGGDAEYQWGFQGGVMILPVITFPADLASEGGCVQVETVHRVDPEFPDRTGDIATYRGGTFAVQASCEGASCATEPLFDVIGVTAADGVRMILEVTVRGSDWARRTELPLRIVDEDGFDECDALVKERDAFGLCSFTRVLGSARIDALGASEVCDEPVELTMTITGESELANECGVTLTQTLEVEAGCLTEMSVGDTMDSSWRIPDDPMCDSPATADRTLLFPFGDAPLSGCCE